MKHTKISIGLLSVLTLIAVPSCVPEGDSSYPSGSYGQGAPRVTQVQSGNYLVNYAGKTASYNSRGIRMSDSGMTSYERSQAQQAVNSYMREQAGSDNHSGPSYGSGGGTPEIRQRGDGKIEARMPSGRVLLYNSAGVLIQKGSGTTYAEQEQAREAVNSYLREQRGSSGV